VSLDSAPSGARGHYSYTHYADRGVAERFDALRFGGPIGQYLLESQARLLVEALAPIAGRSIADVGTGTGRAAIALARAGAKVVGIDASAEMLAVARARGEVAGARVTFIPGDAHALPLGDRSVDAAVSLRVIMHTPDWDRCVGELCRVSRSRVVVDFPALGSVAAIESGYRRLAHVLGLRTEPYRVLAERAVRRSFLNRGFRVIAVHRQFVLPIAAHKMIGSLGVTLAADRALAGVGALRLLGSPVTMVAER
jgi:ubiquinone/menaquinone biosynthesis C-methylase UbiE